MALLNHPLQLGTLIKPYGKIAAVGMLKGERYYWLCDTWGVVSMMPASLIEKMYEG